MSEGVIVGAVADAYGVNGWIKIRSYTQPISNILSYSPWELRKQAESGCFAVRVGRIHGDTVVVLLEGIENRDQALALKGCEVIVARESFSELEPGLYYWADLVGLDVYSRDGAVLGTVASLMETGANDVLIVRGDRERLIPFVPNHVLNVDLVGKRIVVDWEFDF